MTTHADPDDSFRPAPTNRHDLESGHRGAARNIQRRPALSKPVELSRRQVPESEDRQSEIRVEGQRGHERNPPGRLDPG